MEPVAITGRRGMGAVAIKALRVTGVMWAAARQGQMAGQGLGVVRVPVLRGARLANLLKTVKPAEAL